MRQIQLFGTEIQSLNWSVKIVWRVKLDSFQGLIWYNLKTLFNINKVMDLYTYTYTYTCKYKYTYTYTHI